MKIVMCLFVLSLAIASHVRAENNHRIIEVSAIAEKPIDPDLVTMNIEVWSKSASAKQAQNLNATEYTKAKKVFDQFKIKKEDVQTEYYNVAPEYVWDNKTSQNKLVGFHATQTLKITIRKIEEAGSFLDAVTVSDKKNESGVNVNNITWDSSKKAEAEMAGLGDAVKIAKQKAEEIAKAANVKIKSVERISHFANMDTPQVSRYFSMKSRAADTLAESVPQTSVNGGQIKVRVNVTAEYVIE